MLNGEPLGPHRALQGGAVWVADEESRALRNAGGMLWSSRPVPRVALDRQTSASQIYHVGRTSYAAGCGLALAVQWLAGSSDADRRLLRDLLARLGDGGIGGERSAGHGQFALRELPSLTLPDARPGGYFVTLARLSPRREEIEAGLLGGRAAFELERIAGWLAAPGQLSQRRRSAYFIVEGSVLCAAGPEPWGRLLDVRPTYLGGPPFPHPVYRYGFALPVGVAGWAKEQEARHA